MDIDGVDKPHINDMSHDLEEWWKALHDEIEAKTDKLDAQKRIEANDGLKNFTEEFDARTDWAAAQAQLFKAKVSKWWNEFEMHTDSKF